VEFNKASAPPGSHTFALANIGRHPTRDHIMLECNRYGGVPLR
jgi:hypothetical protein